jgi:hypothetical protein
VEVAAAANPASLAMAKAVARWPLAGWFSMLD